MSESQWVKQGGTLSHKNACNEFGLTEEEVIDLENFERKYHLESNGFNFLAVKRLRAIGYTPQLLVKTLTVTYKLM